MRFGDTLMFRSLKADDILTVASFNKISVINACSEKHHPCQALDDIFTMLEDAGGIDNIKSVAWLGIENNILNTLKIACAKLGIKVNIIALEIDPNSVDQEFNEQTNATGNVVYTTDLNIGLEDAKYLHTERGLIWNPLIKDKSNQSFNKNSNVANKVKPYQINIELLQTHNPNVKIMHCMPCHVGYKISRDAIDHPNPLIFYRAENRIHIQKAIILWLLNTSI